MNYDQVTKWQKNHRKGHRMYWGFDTGYKIKEEIPDDNEINMRLKDCFNNIAKNTVEYPIHINIVEKYGVIDICDPKNLFGKKINSYEELLAFAKNYYDIDIK